MNVVLFEDELVTQLYPITVGRAAALITCGSFTLFELFTALGLKPLLTVRSHLREPLRVEGLLGDVPTAGKTLKSQPGEPLVLVNARLVPSVSTVERIIKLARAGRPGIVGQNGSTAVAILPPEAPPFPIDARPAEVVGYLSLQQLAPLEAELPLMQYPHDVLRHHLVVLAENMEYRLQSGEYREIADGVFAAADVKFGQYVVSET